MERISRAEIERRMRNHILILDGAMGTMIQHRKLSRDGNMDMLNLLNPDGVMQIHKDYIAAGAEIITTNTFSSTGISQKEYGAADKVYELNKRGAEIARAAAEAAGNIARGLLGGRMVIVAGSMGPTIKSLSLSPDEIGRAHV